MSASTTAAPTAASAYATPAFWERLWRTSGLQFVVYGLAAAYLMGRRRGAPEGHQ